MTCWQVLELAPDSDARSIKRRYAERLKVCRPDEDVVAFQRLREAYEQALATAQARAEQRFVEPEVGDQETPVDAEFSHLDVVQPAPVERETWLLEIAEHFNADTVQRCLAEARVRHAQLRFENSLLDICLADRDDAPLFAEWALEHLEWLTPWQSPQLPAQRMNWLADRLRHLHMHRLSTALEAGDEDLAEAWVRDFYQQRWMQVLDRALAYSQFLVEWMLANEQISGTFFQRVCGVFGWDERIERLPISEWQRNTLLNRADPHGYRKKITAYLEPARPLTVEAYAAWMLFKPMDRARRRRFADSLTSEMWDACEQLQQEYDSRPAALNEELPLAPGEARQRYVPVRDWPLAGVWLALFWLGVFTVMNRLPHSLHVTQPRGSTATAVFFIECVVGAGCATLLSTGLHNAWSWLAGHLTRVDIALGEWLLPRAISRQGAGLLPLRNALPYLLLGGACATLFAYTGLFEAWQVALIAVAATSLPVAYALLVLWGPRIAVPGLGRIWLLMGWLAHISPTKLAIAGGVMLIAFLAWVAPR